MLLLYLTRYAWDNALTSEESEVSRFRFWVLWRLFQVLEAWNVAEYCLKGVIFACGILKK